ncbi:hypothetical protein JQ614_40425 [Bradyrhizobium diazoefficiens]|uniref:hypothetical protein n=1 Tax=Bradyrhizobium diazoefficiens TaxID=1355477 RepID=UPI001B8C2B73|nr:hypothetical protein [Bradyrhizobium diazoefficiens]MBR0924052.1 hypothetical protein [Bradyrhizobium diazoefficiens]
MTVNVNISAWCALSGFAKPLARLILTPSGIFTPHMAELARAAASSVPQWRHRLSQPIWLLAFMFAIVCSLSDSRADLVRSKTAYDHAPAGCFWKRNQKLKVPG